MCKGPRAIQFLGVASMLMSGKDGMYASCILSCPAGACNKIDACVAAGRHMCRGHSTAKQPPGTLLEAMSACVPSCVLSRRVRDK